MSPERYAELSKKIVEDARYRSTSRTTLVHSGFKEIVAAGDVVIPLILNAMLAEPQHHHFISLFEITGECPIPDEKRGVFHEMRNCWLDWGRSHGYLPPDC